MSTIGGDLSWSVTVTGLVPGTRYEASCQWTPDDGSVGVNTGQSGPIVNKNGNIRFIEDLDALRGNSTEPGLLKTWIRQEGTEFTADPIMLDSGPAVVEQHVP